MRAFVKRNMSYRVAYRDRGGKNQRDRKGKEGREM